MKTISYTIVLSFLLLIPFLTTSCGNEAEVISYPEYKLSYEPDTACFLNTGEERIFTLNFMGRKAVDGILTGQWEKAQPESLSVSTMNNLFEAQYDSVNQTVKISIDENQTEEVLSDSLLITIDEFPANLTIIIPLRQAASRISYDYRIVSEQNPFTIPVGGGEFYIPFTCMCQKTINGKTCGWEYSDMKRLRYAEVCSRWGCQIDLEATDKVGHYKFHLNISDPFDIVDGEQPLLQYAIRTQLFEYPQVEYLKQSFLPERFDPELEYDKYGVVAVSGPIEI